MLYGIATVPGAAAMQTRQVQQPTAILTVISGGVLVRTSAGTYSSAVDGAALYVGSMLRTSLDARALVTFTDGSIVELDAASDITIEDAMGRGGPTIAQSLGRTWHVVMHLTTADSRYEITTPAATASVRGGGYEVVTATGLSGLTMLPSALDHRVTTTVALATKTVTSAQSTTVRVRKLIARTPVKRAAPVVRADDQGDQSEWEKD
jgi:hypothetical protein